MDVVIRNAGHSVNLSSIADDLNLDPRVKVDTTDGQEVVKKAYDAYKAGKAATAKQSNPKLSKKSVRKAALLASVAKTAATKAHTTYFAKVAAQRQDTLDVFTRLDAVDAEGRKDVFDLFSKLEAVDNDEPIGPVKTSVKEAPSLKVFEELAEVDAKPVSKARTRAIRSGLSASQAQKGQREYRAIKKGRKLNRSAAKKLEQAKDHAFHQMKVEGRISDRDLLDGPKPGVGRDSLVSGSEHNRFTHSPTSIIGSDT